MINVLIALLQGSCQYRQRSATGWHFRRVSTLATWKTAPPTNPSAPGQFTPLTSTQSWVTATGMTSRRIKTEMMSWRIRTEMTSHRIKTETEMTSHRIKTETEMDPCVTVRGRRKSSSTRVSASRLKLKTWEIKMWPKFLFQFWRFFYEKLSVAHTTNSKKVIQIHSTLDT